MDGFCFKFSLEAKLYFANADESWVSTLLFLPRQYPTQVSFPPIEVSNDVPHLSKILTKIKKQGDYTKLEQVVR